MIRTTTTLLSTVLALAACNGTTINIDPNTAPPTAASGYAAPTSDLTDPAETVTRKPELQHWDIGSGTVDQKIAPIRISATGSMVNGHPEFVLTYRNTPVVLQWDNLDGRYEGINGNMEIWVYPWYITLNGQASLGWVNITDWGNTYGDSWGLEVGGFNTDPAVVAGRSGSGQATYLGQGGVSLNAQDNSFWASADGPATLIADFDAGTISGWIDLFHNNNSGAVTIANTTLTINPMLITSNTFDGTASINPADFGLSGIGTISVDGMFYEAGATAVGGGISGVGTATPGNGGVTAFLNGAFLAEE